MKGSLALVSCLGIGILVHAPLASARCGPGRLSVWPQRGTELLPNQRLIVTGHRRAQRFVKGLSGGEPRLVPKGRGAAIPLRVVATYVSPKHATQVVLEPAEPLQEGVRYRFSAKGFREAAPGIAWVWRARSRTPGPPPSWTSGPQAGGGFYVRYGCGPA